MCDKMCIDTIGILIAAITMVLNIIMIFIMKKDIKGEIQKLNQRFDNALERAKKKLIYEKYFNTIGKPNNFNELIKKAYDDITKLIPDSSDDYKLEDLLLAKWLVENRDYCIDINLYERDKINKIAKEIYNARNSK